VWSIIKKQEKIGRNLTIKQSSFAAEGNQPDLALEHRVFFETQRKLLTTIY